MEKVVLNEARTAVNGAIVGHSAIEIAEKAGLKVPAGTKMLLAEIPDATMEHPLALEKLSPVLALSNLMALKMDSKSRRHAQFGRSWTYSCYPH